MNSMCLTHSASSGKAMYVLSHLPRTSCLAAQMYPYICSSQLSAIGVLHILCNRRRVNARPQLPFVLVTLCGSSVAMSEITLICQRSEVVHIHTDNGLRLRH